MIIESYFSGDDVMKTLYILPNETVKSGGNWITASRLAGGLKDRGIDVDTIEAKNVTRDKLVKYDVIHSFHVFKSFLKVSDLLMNLNKAIVVSFTGTDVKQLQELEANKMETVELLNKTKAIIVFNKETQDELIREGILGEKIKVIAQTPTPIAIESIKEEKSVIDMKDSNNIIFLFAAGMRQVKAPLELIEMMSDLVKKIDNIKLVLIGPILDKELGKKITEKIEDKEWVEYLGEFSHQDTQRLILESNIVVNSSISEGMPSALLEAQQLGKPILARDIVGNRSVVSHGIDGFLFKNSKEFENYATRLVEDSDLREQMRLSALEASKNYDWIGEISLYEKVYLS